ncbi:MAG TPA: ABC transporter ATP-binding protein [Methylomusa anaerophila]|uniref:Energy-coupling factor transporter ATP-binding protein EcfA1 n=1 Tax=Methylomusa anaerophila TaxID=1930071 RepID=A0A348AHH4_9FIRM|nr:ABC transporter ATP-binding protein [Methylomusa anaerophila]BBB90522.1 energy-coupling factor transporter ATP-binding protein EcfA1 [Methylomusa anaerophila]HML89838.1 ABC transporter ATP-binding protein [Methylomusa anaerophila]
MFAVEFAGFAYAYPESGVILNDINLTIPRGTFTVITGPSGAGKTTLALAVAGVIPHYFGGRQAGCVRVGGINTADSGMGELASQVGTVLADYESQMVAMTVAEEVAFSLETVGLSRREMDERIDQALAMVGLNGRQSCPVTDLSGGQKQRLVIASVLALAPDILVLDEPASALDPEGAAGIYELLAALNKQGKTIIAVEHHLDRVLPYADQIVLLQDGRIAKAGLAGEVIRHMWAQENLRPGVPALWKIKLSLEEKLGLKLRDWLTDEQAMAELKSMTDRQGGEEVKSA